MLSQFMDAVAMLPDTTRLPRATMPELLAWGASNPTHPKIMSTSVNQYLSTIRALFRWAARRELVENDPSTKLERVEDQRGPSEKRRAFQRDELNRIVAAARGQWGAESEDTIMCLLAIFSGLRIAEIGGFEHRDLRRDAEAPGWFLVLRHNRYRRLKVRDSERTVPVHPDVETPLLAHAATVPQDGLLFPKVGPKVGAGVAALSKRFDRLIETHAGINDPRVTWHSLRHAWETHAKDRIPDAGRRYLVGRKETGSARSYDHGTGLAQTVQWVGMLDPLGLRGKSA
jgi:site-specific recombinase XerD